MPTKAAIRREQDKQRKHRVNVFLVIAGIIVALTVGAGQIWYAHQMTATNRPNISVKTTIWKTFGPGLPMMILAEHKNFGNVEAVNVSARSTLVPGPFKTDQEAFDTLLVLNSDQPDTRAILAPGESFQQNLISPHPLKQEDYALIMNGTIKVYFISNITYADTDGHKHGRQVCQFFDPKTQLLTYCQTHNSSY